MTQYLVDIPDPGDAWKEVGQFDSKTAAVEWIRKHIGPCDDDGNICLITTLDDEGVES